MIRAGRTKHHVEWLTPSGHSVRLHALRWWLKVAWGPWVGGLAYDRPLAIEARGMRVRVHDPMAALRSIAPVLVLVSLFTRRIRT